MLFGQVLNGVLNLQGVLIELSYNQQFMQIIGINIWYFPVSFGIYTLLSNIKWYSRTN